MGSNDVEDYIEYLNKVKIRIKVQGTMNEITESENSKLSDMSIGILLHGYVERNKETRIGAGEMGTGEFLSYGTLSAMTRMRYTRFILRDDGEISHWSVRNGELETLLEVINRWAARRVSDGRKGVIPHVKKDRVPDDDKQDKVELDKLGVAGIKHLKDGITNERE